MSTKENISLLEYIINALEDGELPRGFSLPKDSGNADQQLFADGALDGIGIYHMNHSDMSDDEKALMEAAIRMASDGEYDKADALFQKLGETARALSSIDELQSYVINHKNELSGENLYKYAVHLLLYTANRECLKFGLSFLELFNTDSNEKLKDVIRIVGLSDEFTLFSIFVMLRWEDGNNEIWNLARRVHGWGRIHAIAHIEPNTEEIRSWMLTEGVHNCVMPAYSALTCWQKSGAEERLKADLTEDEFKGIRDIIEGLLDEGPVPGISQVEDAESKLILFLNAAKTMAKESDDYEVIRKIEQHYADEACENPEIVAICREILA